MGAGAGMRLGEPKIYVVLQNSKSQQMLSSFTIDSLNTETQVLLPTKGISWFLVSLNGSEVQDVRDEQLLLVSPQGMVIPYSPDSLIAGETYTLPFPIRKAWDWDGDEDGVEELMIWTGNTIYGYTVPELGVGRQKDSGTVPEQISLTTLHPNPFNSTVSVSYTVPVKGNVKVGVYDLAGREVAVLFEGEQLAGSHALNWTAGAVPSGSYLVRLIQGEQEVSRAVQLVK